MPPLKRLRLLLAISCLTECVLGQAGDPVASQGPGADTIVRFYVYDEEVYSPELPKCSGVVIGNNEARAAIDIQISGSTEPIRLGDGQLVAPGEIQTSYTDVEPWLDKLYVHHPWRVQDPAEADLFIVPFNVERSFAAGNCTGNSHFDRIEAMLTALERSPWYTRSGGEDHFWAVMNWIFRWPQHADFFPTWRRPMVSKMVIARYVKYLTHLNIPEYMGGSPRTAMVLSQHEIMQVHAGFHWLSLTDSDLWRCSIVLPILVAPELWVEESFEEWQKRPTLVYFRGKGRDCFDSRNQEMRDMSTKLQDVIPGSFFSNDHAESAERYFDEIKNAKFCLVFGCDDAETSRLYDSVAAGCIPVIISDNFKIQVAPFLPFINYDAFTLTVPEALWIYDPVLAVRAIYGWHQGKFRSLHAGLMAAKKHLSWHHPENTILTNMLRTINSDCLNWQPQLEL